MEKEIYKVTQSTDSKSFPLFAENFGEKSECIPDSHFYSSYIFNEDTKELQEENVIFVKRIPSIKKTNYITLKETDKYIIII